MSTGSSSRWAARRARLRTKSRASRRIRGVGTDAAVMRVGRRTRRDGRLCLAGGPADWLRSRRWRDWLIVLVGALRVLAAAAGAIPRARRGKTVEIASGVWTLLMYLSLGAIPALIVVTRRIVRFIVEAGDAAPDAPVGGKARALAELLRAGFEVPRWFVVTPDAFWASLSSNETASGFQSASDAELTDDRAAGAADRRCHQPDRGGGACTRPGRAAAGRAIVGERRGWRAPFVCRASSKAS